MSGRARSGPALRTGRPRRTIDLPDGLASATRDKHRRSAASFLTWLAEARQAGALDGDPLTDPAGRDWAVRDWRHALKNTRTARGTHPGPATINDRLAAVDAFFALRGSGRPAVVREHLAYCTGLRVAETAALDVADIRLSARKGSVRVRGEGRPGGKDRTVPLHAQVRTSLEELLDELGRPAARSPPHRSTWSWSPS